MSQRADVILRSRHGRRASSSTGRAAFAAALLSLAFSFFPATSHSSTDSVKTWLLKFAGGPSRYLGSKGHRASISEIAGRWRALGLVDVTMESIKVVAPVEEFASISGPGLDGIELHALWPNHARTPSTPRKGLPGRLVDGGHGEASALNGRKVEGAIVLVRLPCSEGPLGWTTPFVLGAKAVIFLEPEFGTFTRVQAEELFLSVPADLPRYWASRDAAEKLERAAKQNAGVRIFCRMTWQEIPTCNVRGTIPGFDKPYPSPDPRIKEQWRDKVVIIHAYTDSNSVIPALAPGAEEAGGLVALMELAEHFSRERVPPTLVFAATAGHGHALAGVHEFLGRHTRREEYFTRSITAEEKIDADYFIGLDLTSGDSRIASFAQGTFYAGWRTDLLARSGVTGMGKVLDAVAKRAWGDSSQEYYLNGILPTARSWIDYLGFRAAFDSDAATFVGTPAMTFATPFDARLRVDTPFDTVERVDVAALARQIQSLKELLSLTLADPEVFIENKLEIRDLARAFKGEVHEFERTVTGLPQKPVPGVLMTTWAGNLHSGGVRAQKTLGPVRGIQAWMSQYDDPLTVTVTETGQFRLSILRSYETWGWVGFPISAFVFDYDGKIILTTDQGPNTSKLFTDYPWFYEREGKTLHVLFRCKPYTILEPVDARYLAYLDSMLLVDGLDQQFMNYGSFIFPGPAVVVFAPDMDAAEVRMKALLSTGSFGLKGIFTGADPGIISDPKRELGKREAEGRGYPVDEGVLKYAPFEGAKDMWVLDEMRGCMLRKYHIRSLRVEELHEMARGSLEGSLVALKDMRYDDFLTEARKAWGLEARAYPEFKSVANDMVRTVIFYCILLIPFSFCLERLFFSFADLRRQIAGTAGVFVAGFLALYQVHPAFRISSNPILIFLGFTVFALSLIVLAIISTKFQRELRRIKGERGDYESVDISRASATLAALILGLSNLRKRPLRTTLTITTVVFLTFTVLSLVSMSSTIQFFRLPRGTNPAYAGALIRGVTWQPLNVPVEAYLNSAVGNTGLLVPRSWVTGRTSGEHFQLEVTGKGGKVVVVSGLVGLSPLEREVLKPQKKIMQRGRWFSDEDRRVCILPDNLARSLNSGIGDTVQVRGEVLTVVGICDGDKLGKLKDLDNEAITPAKQSVTRERFDWEADTEVWESSASGASKTAGKVTEDFKETTHVHGDQVIIVPHRFAMSIEGKLRSIAIVPKPGVGTAELLVGVKEFLVRTAVMALVSDGSTIQLITSIGAVSVKGILALTIPLLLASLIILNTMMGSVHERVREISIFSSVGLSPMHIGALFFAEAFVVAVVGVVLGYLLSQIVAAVLLSVGTLAGLSLNYSSSAAVGASIMVMAVVMLSTIYPARRASEMAVPDVSRRWRLPKLSGDVLSFDFPFTVGTTDLVGMFAYLSEIFHAFRDSSVGEFATDRVKLTRTHDGIELTMVCWLSPYDLGISQAVKMEAKPMEVGGLYRIRVTLERRSGEVAAWYRQNRRFLTTLRKRFLVWRMFGPEFKARYATEGNAEMDAAGKAETVA